MTKIEWTDETWNPVVGCSIVSKGCTNCYAMRVAHRLGQQSGKVGDRYRGLTRVVNGNPVWTGIVRAAPKETLSQPLRWRRPRRIFVNSMSDLFHECLPDAVIDRVFAVMALCPQHQFQILTKRPERMRDYLGNIRQEPGPNGRALSDRAACVRTEMGRFESRASSYFRQWLPPNVWLGVSVEDQASADARIPHLLETPAAVRFVSYEPALKAVDFTEWFFTPTGKFRTYEGRRQYQMVGDPKLDWIIVGGESGPGARPMELVWARSIVKQCHEAAVPCFVKQLGSNARCDNQPVEGVTQPGLGDHKGGDPSEWPVDLRVREYPDG